MIAGVHVGSRAVTGLFSRKPTTCAVCGKETSHAHKPKREWGISGKLCGNCHVDKTKAYFDSMTRQACSICGQTKHLHDLWEPQWQWNIDGLLCNTCFNKKSDEYKKMKTLCSLCGVKMGFVRYNPKPKWKITGQLCRQCWDLQKYELG